MSEAMVILIASGLLLTAVFASRLSERFGVPSLLLFLAIGMLAGSEGIGHIPFDDASVVVLVGSIALALILFSGGLSTETAELDRRMVRSGALLATVGVVITTAVVALTGVYLLKMPWQEALLIGAILSSTDAAAVFSVLGTGGTGISARMRTLMEFESGSNDPTAVFLTVSFIAHATGGLASPALLPLSYLYRMVGGAAIGWLGARLLLWLLDKVKLGQEGLYPGLTLGTIGIVFGVAEVIHSSGFMAVYVVGLMMATEVFVHRASLTRFHDGVAWLMQIAMFLILGLLVTPSSLVTEAGPASLLAVALIFVARPAAVFISLIGSGFTTREKVLISWAGLRGAVPIVLATFPLVAGVTHSDQIFNMVFFAVVLSVVVQAPTVGWLARRLGLAVETPDVAPSPLELNVPSDADVSLTRLQVAEGSAAVGETLVHLRGEERAIVALVRRKGRLFIPNGSTELRSGDELFVVGTGGSVDALARSVE